MKKLLAVLGAASMIMGLTVPSASAAPTGSVTFTCDMTLPWWPGDGGGVDCEGIATGVVVSGGIAIPCLPSCDLHAYIHSYSEPCMLQDLPIIGDYWGEIYVEDLRVGSFVWKRAGASLIFTDEGELEGKATWTPTPTVIPTCAMSGPLPVTVTGHFSRVP